MATQLWKIELFVESDDFDECDRLVDEVARLACDDADGEDHVCRLPWFTVSSNLDEVDATMTERDELNR